MAEDRRKEPNLELPSLFGRKKKQRGGTPPEDAPGTTEETSATAAPTDAPSDARDTSGTPDTGRTPTQPTPRPATGTGRRRPPPPPPPGAGVASAPAAGSTRRPPTPPPTPTPAPAPERSAADRAAHDDTEHTRPLRPVSEQVSEPVSEPGSEPESEPGSASPQAAGGTTSPDAAAARDRTTEVPSSERPVTEATTPARPASPTTSQGRGPDYEDPYDPRDASRQDRPVASAPAASAATETAASAHQGTDLDADGGGRRGRRLPWGRKRSEPSQDDGSEPAASAGTTAAATQAPSPGAAGPGRRRPAPAAPTAAGATSAHDSDTLTAAPTTTTPAQGDATEQAAAPRRRALRRPRVDPRVGTIVVGIVVGLIGVVLFYLAQVGCNAVRGVNSCGGLGVAALLLVAAVEVVVGSALLKAMSLTETTSTSLLAVGMVAVIAMAFFFGALGSVWMFLVLPVLTGATFLASWWITHSFVEDIDA